MQISLLDIPGLLIERGIVRSIAAANATTLYVVRWAEGVTFDFSKSAVATHRARLRKIGLDIARPYLSGTGEYCNLIFETNVKGFD